MINQRRTLFLTMAVFALEPLSFGAWLALIPDVKQTLALNKAELAVALLGMPIAIIPALSIASRLVVRFGPRRLLMYGLPIKAVAAFLPLLAQSQIALFFALACWGICVAFLQVGLNVYASRFEKETGRIVMNRCHGFWALGIMIGSLIATSFVDWSALWAMAIATTPATVAGIWCAWALPRLGADAVTTAPPRRKLRAMPSALFLIAIYALATSMTEGAMSDWAAVYLAERLPEGSSGAGIAVSIYAGFLAAGRFLGDAANVRFGVVLLAKSAVASAVAGLLLLLLPLPLAFAYVGFALVGLGASVGYPLAVSAVAGLDNVHEGANIATLSLITIMGFLAGPPLIGFLAESFGLRVGLAALLPGLALGFVLSRELDPVNRRVGGVNRSDSPEV